MSFPYDRNTYRATILRHVDADTTWAEVDLGFDASIKLTFRWAGIDAPEKNTPEGKIALMEVKRLLPEGSRCLIETEKDSREKFGRYLAWFYTMTESGHTDENVNAYLIDLGMVKPYDGGPR
jgi:endonuclease YncB( thermonuclease family)